MTLQAGPVSTARKVALRRLVVVAAATAAWIVIAVAGWKWIQFADRVLELPGLRVAVHDWAVELFSPDGVMRRAVKRTTRG